MKKGLLLVVFLLVILSCKKNKNEVVKESATTTELSHKPQLKSHFDWDAANIYFLLTDRFNNGVLPWTELRKPLSLEGLWAVILKELPKK